MSKTLCIKNACTNPYFNLALEEYFLKNSEHDIFMLWQNRPTIVVGKHQNLYAEINHDFVEKNRINIARRLSGGGAVYHDLGNVNFSYIITGKKGHLVNFAKYTDDIINILQGMNVKARRNKRNDITVDNKKISGNAEHVFKNRVLHHGTLLFSSDIDILNKAIRVSEKKYIDKAVQSVRSKVANISNYIDIDINTNEFINKIMNFALQNYPNSQLYEINDAEKSEIEKLKTEKYSSWDWIYGYSPKYSIDKVIEYRNKELNIKLSVSKGIITDLYLSGNNFNENYLNTLSALFIGKKHDKNILEDYLKAHPNNGNDYAELIINAIF